MTDPPPFPHDDVTEYSPETCPRTGFASSGAEVADRSRACPRTVPVSAKRVLPKRDVLDGLRARVREIERHPPGFDIRGSPQAAATAAAWTLGAEDVDRQLGSSLSTSSLHEIKPEFEQTRGPNAKTCGGAAAAQAAAIGFALRLCVRRCAALARTSNDGSSARPRPSSETIVWCWPSAIAAEHGRLYGPGLAALGLDPSQLLIVETRRATETLWAIEEALRSHAAILVAGVVGSADLTAARRLSLATESFATPCLLVTGGSAPSTPAATSRWRVGLLPPSSASAGARSGCKAGERGGNMSNEAFQAAVTVERWRTVGPWKQEIPPFALEWCDEAHRFRSLAHVADRMSDGADVPYRRIR